MQRTFVIAVATLLVLGSVGCGANREELARSNRALLHTVAVEKLSVTDRHRLEIAVERNTAEGVSLSGKSVAQIVAEQRNFEIIAANKRLIAENARYNKFHPAMRVVPKEQNLDGPTDGRPLVSGAFDRAGSSL